MWPDLTCVIVFSLYALSQSQRRIKRGRCEYRSATIPSTAIGRNERFWGGFRHLFKRIRHVVGSDLVLSRERHNKQQLGRYELNPPRAHLESLEEFRHFTINCKTQNFSFFAIAGANREAIDSALRICSNKAHWHV